MGAWGHGSFDNDTACDWAYELEDCEDLSFVEQTLQNVLLTGEDDLDADIGSQALAACEVVARSRGKWGVRNSYTETADRWVEAHPSPAPDELAGKARAAIDRILTEPSELLELWEDSGDSAEWRKGLTELKGRLT